MNRKFFIFLFFVFCSLTLFGQGIKDSIFKLAPIVVQGEQLFKKEKAGMKESQMDSIVLSQKINLSLSELLSENTSVFIKNNGRGALSTASFRGTAPSHTQVSWNGININTPMLGMVDFSLIPVYIIDDVNLKYGTASIADKSGGLGGSINTRNKVNWNKKFELKYLQGAGSYDTYDEFLQIGGGNKSFHTNTRLYHNYSKNDFTYLNRLNADIDPTTGNYVNPLDTNKNAAFTRYGLLQEIYFKTNKRNIIALRYWGQYSSRSIPHIITYEGLGAANINNEQNVDHKVVGEWKRIGEKSKLLLRSGFSGKHFNYNFKNKIAGDSYKYVVSSESYENSSLNTFDYTHSLSDNFSAELRIDGNFHDVLSRDTVKQTSFHEQRNEYSVLVGIYKEFFKQLNVNLMLREDFVDGAWLPIIPYLGVDYKLFKKKDLLFKANIARNYHLPSLSDLYWQPSGNPNLLPEEGYSVEMGFEYKLIQTKSTFSTELTAYHSDINNWIVWIPNLEGNADPFNIKRVTSKGIELSTKWSGRLGKVAYNLSGVYAYTPTINYGEPIVWGDESYGKQLVFIPKHSGNAMINLAYKGFYVTYQHNSYGRRFRTTSNNINSSNDIFPAYFMNDLIFGKEFSIKKIEFDLEFKIFNMFDENYYSILLQPMPGRNYLLQIQMKL